jgi:hypothetical protein
VVGYARLRWHTQGLSYLVREFSEEVPDPRLVARQYEALVARAERLVGGRAALEEMVGELR